MKKLTAHLTYANVISTLCLFLLLGGGAAVAASSLGKNSVGPKQLKKNSVTAAKIKNGAVTNAKLGGDAVTEAKLAAGAVTTGKLADNSVTGAKVADGSLTGADINQSTLTGVRASNVYSLQISNDSNCSPIKAPPAGFGAERQNEGICVITLPFAASSCTVTATPSLHNLANNIKITTTDRSIQLADYTDKPNSVYVYTILSDKLVDLSFDMNLVC